MGIVSPVVGISGHRLTVCAALACADRALILGGVTDDTAYSRTPGLPGVFAEFMWVDSPDFGGTAQDRRIPRVYDVDPAPLARLIGVLLKLTGGNIGEHIAAVADDDRNGPIHIAHLLGACQYAAHQAGGTVPYIPGLSEALRTGGLKGATAAIREMDRQTRHRVLDGLLGFWHAAISGLCIDITDEQLGLGGEPE